MSTAKVKLNRSLAKVWLIGLTLLVSGQAQAGGGGVIGNGGGVAEQGFAYALASLDRVYDICWSRITECLNTQEERAIFEKVRVALPTELKNPNLLKFIAGHTDPAKFFLDGQVRTAVTGNRVQDTIFINTDLIYRPNSSGTLTPIDLGTSVAILTHELGHHQGVRDHQILDLIGARLNVYISKQSDVLRLDTYGDTYDMTPMAAVVLYAFHSEMNPDDELRGSQTRLALTDGVRYYDLNSSFEDNLTCPSTRAKVAFVLGYRLYQLRWLKRKDSPMERVLRLRASAFVVCDEPLPRGDNDYDVILEMPIRLENVEGSLHWVYHPELFRRKFVLRSSLAD